MLIQFVRVTTDERKFQLWAAATAREDAINRVLDAIPEGWTASLVDETPHNNISMNMMPGEVRELRGTPVATQA